MPEAMTDERDDDEEREDIVRSALEWRAEQARRAKPTPIPGHARPNGNDAAPLLPLIDVATFANKPEPIREFLDSAQLFPMRNVVLLMGDGGTGKSLLALQLAIACATATSWLGIDVQSGPVLYLSAEEEEDEVHRRVKAICQAEDIDPGRIFGLQLAVMAGQDAVLAFEKQQNRLEVTPLYRSLEATLGALSPMVLILDNLADVFAGNENNRSLAKHFVGVLRHLAIKYDCTIILLAHPSVAGMLSGSGTSGSTAWNNSVRARLHLHRPDGLDAEDTDQRILEVKKANYAPTGQRYGLRWIEGRFIRSDPKSPFDRVSVADLEKVRAMVSTGRYRQNEQAAEWLGYAVADLLDFDVGRGIPAKQRSAEQNKDRDDIRLFLATWTRTEQLFVVKGLDAKREPTLFYSTVKEE